MRRVVALILALLIPPLSLSAARAEVPAVTKEEAHAIGVDAYLYLYSLVTMDLTRLQFTNVQEVGNFKGPMNVFVNVRTKYVR